ncbi:hypothetical protein MHYP_G00167540 [Metynnis hypsauchen]
MKQLPDKVKGKLQTVHASSTLTSRNYISWLRQVHCRPGGRLYAIKEEVLRLDAEKWKAAKFCPPRWPPVVSIMERERRKRARRELEWVGTVEASAQDPQLSSRRSRPHTHSGGRQTEAPVTISTVYRRKKAAEEDKRILGEAGTVHRWQVPAGLPCNLCGQPKRLEFGHFKIKRKMDITSYFCTKKMNNSEGRPLRTEPGGVKRAEEKQVESTTESEQEDLGDTGFQREGTEQEREDR